MLGVWQTEDELSALIVAGGEKMSAYDPETLIILRNALDGAWALLSEDRKTSTLKSDMADRILRRAAEGERDPVRLRSAALFGPVRSDVAQGQKAGLKWIAKRMTVHSTPSLIPIERPRCTRCQARMMLARIEPYGPGFEKRTFECPKCNFIETKIVGDLLKSAAVVGLAENLKPPS